MTDVQLCAENSQTLSMLYDSEYVDWPGLERPFLTRSQSIVAKIPQVIALCGAPRLIGTLHACALSAVPAVRHQGRETQE